MRENWIRKSKIRIRRKLEAKERHYVLFFALEKNKKKKILPKVFTNKGKIVTINKKKRKVSIEMVEQVTLVGVHTHTHTHTHK